MVDNHFKIHDELSIRMHVLAVDNDPTYLQTLEAMLRDCEYKVTATNNAITALQLLRENTNKFDLIIADELDGFKLLEFLGKEPDIPVVLLSVTVNYNNPEMILKGIIHGACDHLLKPVRLEELQHIWHHVFRKMIDSKQGTETSNNQH